MAARHEDGFYFIYTMVWITNRCEESDGLRKTKATRHQLKTHTCRAVQVRNTPVGVQISVCVFIYLFVYVFIYSAGRRTVFSQK